MIYFACLKLCKEPCPVVYVLNWRRTLGPATFLSAFTMPFHVNTKIDRFRVLMYYSMALASPFPISPRYLCLELFCMHMHWSAVFVLNSICL